MSTRTSIPPVYLLAAGLYGVNAARSVFSNGWQQPGWIGWALMAAGFILLAQLPEETRRSFRRILQSGLGMITMVILIVAVALLWIPTAR